MGLGDVYKRQQYYKAMHTPPISNPTKGLRPCISCYHQHIVASTKSIVRSEVQRSTFCASTSKYHCISITLPRRHPTLSQLGYCELEYSDGRLIHRPSLRCKELSEEADCMAQALWTCNEATTSMMALHTTLYQTRDVKATTKAARLITTSRVPIGAGGEDIRVS